MPSWPRIPGGLLPTFQRSTQRECQDFTCLFGMAFGFPRPHPTTSSPSSTPQSWRLWAIQLYVSGFPIWDRRFSRASNRRRRRSAPSKRPRSTSGGRSSRPRISRENKSGSRLAFQGSNMMKLPRRRFLHLAAAAAALPAVSRVARAQAYPARPVTIIDAFAPGGNTDFAARIVGQHMSRTLRQQFIVENVAGAGGTTGPIRAMRAKPDGYTIQVGHTGTHAFSVSFYPNLAFKPDVDFEPIGMVAEQPLLIVARKDFPPKDLKEFIAYVKTNAEKLNMAHAGVGSITFTFGLLLNSMMGVKPTVVPFNGGGPAMNALIGGQVDYMCASTSLAGPQVQSGMVNRASKSADLF